MCSVQCIQQKIVFQPSMAQNTSVLGDFCYKSFKSQDSTEEKCSTTQLEIPDDVEQLDLVVEQRYWRRNLKWTLCPLLLCGIPVYLFFISDKHWIKGRFKKRKPVSILKWWLFIISASRHNTTLAIINLIYFLAAIAMNVGIIISLYPPFYALLVLGEFKRSVFSSLYYSVQKILFLVAVNGVWLYGYRIRIFVLDLICYEPLAPIPFKSLPFIRLRLGAFFVFLMAAHVLHSYVYLTQRFPEMEADAMFILKWLLSIVDPVLASFCFPIFASLAWTLHRHTLLLRLYLKTTTSSAEIVIPRFKDCFKIVSGGFQNLTAMFGVYFSWAIIVFMATITGDMSDFAYIVKNSDEDASLVEASVFLIEWSPMRVRAFVWLFIIIALKISLVVYVVNIARTSNIEAKYIIVALNDFMAGPAGQNLLAETYQSFRLLKYYVESRFAAGTKASLLNIPVASIVAGMSRTQLNTVILAFTQFSFIMTFITSEGDSLTKSYFGIFNTTLFSKEPAHLAETN